MRTRKIIYTDKNGNKHELYYPIVFSNGVCTGEHKYKQLVNIPPTCTEKGYGKRLCLWCGEYINNEIEPLGHDWGDWYQDEATGDYYCDCLRCGHQKIQQAGSYVYTLLDDGKYSVSGGNDLSGDIFIPSEYCGTPITVIADYAFFYNRNIINVEIPKGVTRIGENAFAYCVNLIGVKIPDSVYLLGSSVFYKCENLERVELSEGIRTISADMFGFCRNLVEVNIPDTVTLIGSNAFEECSSLTRITIPDGVTSIGSYAFYDCYSLANLFIPASVQRIHYGAFRGCANLSIEVDENSKYYRMRNGCLWEIKTSTVIHGEVEEIPDDTIAIGDGAFYGNTYFAPIKIPLSVTKIGSLALGGKPVKVYVEATSKPENWADDWCDENVEVVWGYKEDETCTHSYGGWVTTVQPTCTMLGIMKRICSLCGHVDTAKIESLRHDYEDVITTEPTCLTSGVKTSTCKRCGIVTTSYIPHLGHDWDKGFVRIEPTCTTNGVRRHTCTRCGDIADMGISALRHDWGEWKVVHPAECEIDGMRERKCTRCNDVEFETIKAEGHDWDIDVEVIEPTCTESGYTIHKCNNCTETYIDTYTDPIGHNIVNGVCTRCHNGKKGIVYYGVSAIPESYDNTFILGLGHSTPSDTHLASISTRPLAGEYIYYCVPISFGDCAFIYNNFVGGFSLIIEGLALTNAGGKTEAYNIYKSNQANLGANGAITITITEKG